MQVQYDLNLYLVDSTIYKGFTAMPKRHRFPANYNFFYYTELQKMIKVFSAVIDSNETNRILTALTICSYFLLVAGFEYKNDPTVLKTFRKVLISGEYCITICKYILFSFYLFKKFKI